MLAVAVELALTEEEFAELLSRRSKHLPTMADVIEAIIITDIATQEFVAENGTLPPFAIDNVPQAVEEIEPHRAS